MTACSDTIKLDSIWDEKTFKILFMEQPPTVLKIGMIMLVPFALLSSKRPKQGHLPLFSSSYFLTCPVASGEL